MLGWLSALAATELAALTAGIVLLGVLVVEGTVLVSLLRQNGRLLLRVETLEQILDSNALAAAAPPEEQEAGAGLSIGTRAPAFSLPGLHGETLTLDALRVVGNPVLLVFTESECHPCDELLPEIAAWQRDRSPQLMVSLIGSGSVESIRMKTSEQGIYNVVVQHDNEIADAYGVPRAPSAVIVTPDGTIGSGVAVGAEMMRRLVEATTGASTAVDGPSTPSPESQASVDNVAAAASGSNPPSLAIGQPAPSIRLRDLRGKNVSLASKRGVKTMVLFWDPSCGFCNQILEDLKGWERDAREELPELLIVSTGSLAENGAMRLRSQILLDEGFSAGTAFGAEGTPSAVMVDEEGYIASDLAVGGQAVLSLVRGELPGEADVVHTPAVGDPAPPIRLPDLAGEMIDLSELIAKDILLLFWNPSCGFCQRMLQDLRTWEETREDTAPDLLVVSTGTVEANREQGLLGPVVLDQSFAIARSFGADGTPMAVLVDKHGRIASEPVSGAGAVLELARGKRAVG